MMKVLGIETSCDETAFSVVEDGREVLSNVIFSSQHLHQKFGGIVPEVAARHHVEKICYALEMLFENKDFELTDMDLIAVTRGPGLIGSLLIGFTAAKWISFILNKPIIGINHLQAHLFSSLLDNKDYSFPALGLIVSGGHTSTVFIKNYVDFQLIGSTLDDAAGEAFDKVAKLLELGYPGGPVIEKIAKKGNERKICFPVGLRGALDFSFSGLKTAVLYYVKDNLENRKMSQIEKNEIIADICASFQITVINTLILKLKKAFEEVPKIENIFTGGGVMANAALKERLIELARWKKVRISFPDSKFCTDNAAMVAKLGYEQYNILKEKRDFFERNFRAEPGLKLEDV